MTMSEYFDYESVATEAEISPDHLKTLRRHAEEDYPGDLMMVELRLLRTCSAVKDGRCTVNEALKPEPQMQGQD